VLSCPISDVYFLLHEFLGFASCKDFIATTRVDLLYLEFFATTVLWFCYNTITFCYMSSLDLL
jgi:hypothetical protein